MIIKNLVLIALLTGVQSFCTAQSKKEGQTGKATGTESVISENLKSIIPLEREVGFDKSDTLNAKAKMDRELLFKSIQKGIKSGKLKAYSDYPKGELSPDQVDGMLVTWDSTNQVEDPTGQFVNAPIKFEVSADFLTRIVIQEKLSLNTSTYQLIQQPEVITLYIYLIGPTGGFEGERKLFDVKLPD